MAKGCGLWSQTVWVQILGLLNNNSIAYGSILHSYKFQLLSLKWGLSSI